MSPAHPEPPNAALVRSPDGAEALPPAEAVRRAIAALRGGQLAEAERWCRAVLDGDPDHFGALHVLGVVAARTGRLPEAIELLSHAASVDPAAADVWISRGNALRDLARNEEALASYDRAIALRPDFAEAHNNRGNLLRRLGRCTEALESYDRALALKPAYAEAWNNRGNALRDLRRHAEAIASYDRALALRPDYADASSNRGNALREVGRLQEALVSCDRALGLKPDHVDALCNRGAVLADLKRHAEAAESLGRALGLAPACPFLYGAWLRTRMQVCDWRHYSRDLGRLVAKIESSETASSPFAVLALSDSPALQRRAAEIWAETHFASRPALSVTPGHGRHDRLRVGYFSADFRDHPVSALTAELFERHDRSRFELVAFSYGPDTGDAMRARIAAAFETFVDVRALGDVAIAQRAREMEIDVAVDLGGYTADARTGIFAARAAPLQVSYLGYPGTMGADFIDYLIADRTVVPETQRRHYAERIVYLRSFQANDTTRPVAARAFTREELGLPPSGFVFCCFNNNYKITPATFDRWMAILRRVGGSVLFLYAENERAAVNLRSEAASRGVDPQRLVFGARLPMAEYLARYRAADLFLDTAPYNGGATGSDALWAGLPVLTCPGATFAGRMGASLLEAVGLPELVARTPEAYERLAVELATDPDHLGAIRRELDARRRASSLFDMARYTRELESAYVAMHERRLAGLPPADLQPES